MRHIAVVPADMISMVPAFLADRGRDLDELRQALSRSDFGIVQAIGERLYALGEPYGFDGITSVGKRIRQACADSDAALVLQLLDELQDYLGRVEVTEGAMPVLPKWQSASPPWMDPKIIR